jgi:hypothetical protein
MDAIHSGAVPEEVALKAVGSNRLLKPHPVCIISPEPRRTCAERGVR